jgi:hypothetical protein
MAKNAPLQQLMILRCGAIGDNQRRCGHGFQRG